MKIFLEIIMLFIVSLAIILLKKISCVKPKEIESKVQEAKREFICELDKFSECYERNPKNEIDYIASSIARRALIDLEASQLKRNPSEDRDENLKTVRFARAAVVPVVDAVEDFVCRPYQILTPAGFAKSYTKVAGGLVKGVVKGAFTKDGSCPTYDRVHNCAQKTVSAGVEGIVIGGLTSAGVASAGGAIVGTTVAESMDRYFTSKFDGPNDEPNSQKLMRSIAYDLVQPSADLAANFVAGNPIGLAVSAVKSGVGAAKCVVKIVEVSAEERTCSVM